jgi:methionyl-tRNA formyltransferase
VRVVFMGTPGFAVVSLERLAERHEVVAAYTTPDRPAGRGSALRPSPVKERALELGIPVAQPESLRGPDAADGLRAIAPDVVCVAAYGMLLPGTVLDVPAYGCLNVHASLLPLHRGAAPIERAILAGDERSGVSIMRMEETLDTGPVAAQTSVDVGDLNADELADVLAELGAELLLDVLDSVAADSVTWTPQDDSLATYAAKLTKSDVRLEAVLSVADALRRVRASSRRAACRVSVCGTVVRILAATASERSLEAGTYEALGDSLVLGFSDGAIEALRVHPANKGAMGAEAFVCGMRGEATGVWSAA